MKKFVAYFALAGGVIPVVLMLANYIELIVNITRIPYATRYGRNLWPFWLMMMGWHPEEFSLGMYTGLCMAIGLNVLLYALIGATLAGLWRLLALMKCVT